jgi:hypothetical protein
MLCLRDTRPSRQSTVAGTQSEASLENVREYRDYALEFRNLIRRDLEVLLPNSG